MKLGHCTYPDDILVPNWELGRPGAFDLTITSPLNSTVLSEASVRAGSASQASEKHKHQASDDKCQELGTIDVQTLGSRGYSSENGLVPFQSYHQFVC